MKNPTDLHDVANAMLGLDWRGMDAFANIIATLGTTDRHKVATKMIAWAENVAGEDNFLEGPSE